MTDTSGGIRNWARTSFQSTAPGRREAWESASGRKPSKLGCPTRAAEPPTAKRRAKSRRFMDAWLIGSSLGFKVRLSAYLTGERTVNLGVLGAALRLRLDPM